MHFCFALMQNLCMKDFSMTDVLFHVGPRKQLNSCIVTQNFKMSLKLLLLCPLVFKLQAT